MKKIFLLLSIVIFAVCAGCSHNPGPIENPADKNPSALSDFECAENEDGSITITKYVGAGSSVIIPSNIGDRPVTQIGSCAFQHNDTIVSVEMPDSVTLIEQKAFEDCTSLSAVSLSRKLKSIAANAFMDCSNLSIITLPDSLTVIKGQAFLNCTALKHINIPKNITHLGRSSFQNSGIETIDFEDGIEVIGECAFLCTNIKTVTLPKSVRKIEYAAFGSCAQLESVVLNEGIITLESRAFGGKSKLTEIIIPSSVIDMDETFCDYNNSLKTVKFEGDAPENYRTETTEAFIAPLKEYGYTNYTVYYHEGATGFTSPEWCGYPTEIW